MLYNTQIDLVKNRKRFFMISLTILLLGLLSLMIFGLNLGVDFKSGTRLEVLINEPFDEAKIKGIFDEAGYPYNSIRSGGDAGSEMAIARFEETLSTDAVEKIQAAFNKAYGRDISTVEYKVDPVIGQELATKAIWAVLIASIGIIIYVTIRFEYRFAVAAVIALLHDAFFVIAIFSLFRLEVDLPFVAAVLTIVGYSINDTIVIFDRIRENLRTTKTKIKTPEDLARLVNDSLWQTMTRSINTVLTVVFTAAALLIFGSESIRLFSLAMLLGLLSGAYSSIFIAAQVWFVWKSKSLTARKSLAVGE